MFVLQRKVLAYCCVLVCNYCVLVFSQVSQGDCERVCVTGRVDTVRAGLMVLTMSGQG